jgi:hypothetical protein
VALGPLDQRPDDAAAVPVDSRCEHVQRAVETWDGTERHKSKDALDGLRYALVQFWAMSRRASAGPAPRLY